MIAWLREQIESNDIFGGVIGASFMGGLFVAVKLWGKRLMHWLLSTVTVSLTVRSEDEAFNDLQEWFQKTHYMRHRCRRMRVSSVGSGGEKSIIGPDAGAHWIIYNRRLAVVTRIVEEKQMSWRTREKIIITMFGRNRSIMLDFLDNALHVSHENSIIISSWCNGWWGGSRRRKGRDAGTLFLNEGVLEEIIRDVRRFLKSAALYTRRGVPYHRGYLFHGPPGTGKTSVATVIATEFAMGVRYMNLNAFKDDNDLLSAMTSCPPRSVILIEDVDAAGNAKQRRAIKPKEAGAKEEAVGVTTSGLLNALDGIIYPEGSIFVLTTNFPEKLDAALTRSGRVDKNICLGFPTASTAIRMILYYHGSISPEVRRWVSESANSLSQADWQNILAHATKEDLYNRLTTPETGGES